MTQDPKDRPKPPKGLQSAQRRLWAAIVEAFELEDHHLRTLESACRELDRAERAEAAIAEQGEYVEDRYGAPKAHPAVAVARSSRLAAARLLRELGLEDDVQVDVRRLPRSRGYRPYDRKG
jgi:phage terminase small subunit